MTLDEDKSSEQRQDDRARVFYDTPQSLSIHNSEYCLEEIENSVQMSRRSADESGNRVIW